MSVKIQKFMDHLGKDLGNGFQGFSCKTPKIIYYPFLPLLLEIRNNLIYPDLLS